MTSRLLFVAGAHTEIGKTHAGCGLLRAARGAGWSVDALKPVVSGFDERDWSTSDPGRILAAMGRTLDRPGLQALSPWRYHAALAPPSAARLEGRRLPMGEVADFCRARSLDSRAELMLVEGVGGIMSPIAEDGLTLDLLEALDCPCILVGGGYLGAVSHTLTALEVLRSRGRTPVAIVISEDADGEAPALDDTVDFVKQHAGGVDVVSMPRAPSEAWSQAVLRRLEAEG